MPLRFDCIARLSKGSRAIFCLGAAWLLCAGAALPQDLTPPPIDKSREEAALRAASELDDNSADIKAVLQVCTQCHSSGQFLSPPRTSSGWEQVYGQMARNGARPTGEQIDAIVRYFQRNLTIVNVNTSPAEELGPTLQTGPQATIAIVTRRVQKPFVGIVDLATIPGVDRRVLEKLKDRLLF